MKTISDVKLSYLVKKLLGKIKDSNDEITAKVTTVEEQSNSNKDDIARLQADTAAVILEEVLWEDESMFEQECDTDMKYPSLPRPITDYDYITIYYLENIRVTRGPFVGKCYYYPSQFTKGGVLFEGLGASAFAYKPAIFPFETQASMWTSTLELYREIRLSYEEDKPDYVTVDIFECKNSAGAQYNYALIPYKMVGHRKITTE